MSAKIPTVANVMLINFALSSPLYIAAGLITAITMGLWLSSWFVFWLFLIGVSFGLMYATAKRQVRKATENYTTTRTKAFSGLQKVDYYHATTISAISIDVGAKKLALIESPDSKAVVIPLEKVINYYNFRPDRVEHTAGAVVQRTTVNGGAMDRLTDQALNKMSADSAKTEAARKNIMEKMKQNAKTGLYFEIDDLNKPKVFIHMMLDDTEGWLLVLKKLFDGSLEARDKPMEYPASP